MKKISLIFICIFFFGNVSCVDRSVEIVFHKSHEPKKAEAPFSDVVEANGFLFLSGQVGMNHKSRTLVEGGIEAETKQCIENIKAVLEHHDSSLDKVVKCTVILKDINDFGTFNEIYKGYFPKKPARTTFAASGLAVGAHIEIDVIAAK
ncbi:RidA family protein [Psychroserpens sp. Hel_I_66]|uniref:RidA family protein n=1 Tax=Psychroserpens sp. Hel_I_66 TaxID=1250004 RepID=UPI00064568FF|nr:Rid family detoxifying hydrolase [Psychroserpens sp. Hel_I_66]